MKESQKRIANQIAVKYGPTSQIEMAIEEMAELTLALQKVKRGHKNPVRAQEYKDQVVNEIADVIIMMEQLKFIYDDRLIEQQITYKLNRQVDRMQLEL